MQRNRSAKRSGENISMLVEDLPALFVIIPIRQQP
jgi:hypothetical protein